ncbi:MAG TPA: hypothetical protein PK280_15775 [Planctomycetota bacterium]|nr:hypothetical protein [Planctomycetota bacterium]
MPLSADEKISAAVAKLREFILYNHAPDGTSYEAPGDDFVPPVGSPTTRIYCGEILRALKDGSPLPPGVDGAELQAAVYAVKHNPGGFDRENVGSTLAFAWQAYIAWHLTTGSSRRSELLAMVTRTAELLAARWATPVPRNSGSLEETAAALSAMVATRGEGRIHGGIEAGELREVCAEISTRAYAPTEIDRLCRIFETFVTALETAPNA